MKIKKILCICLAFIILSFPVNLFAKEEIQVILEQPAKLSAKAGEDLYYYIDVNLPENYETIYKSFVVTVLTDKNLSVEDISLRGAQREKGKIDLKTSSVKNNTQYLTTLSVNDLGYLKGVKNLKVGIKTRVKSNVSNVENFKNSIIVTSVNNDGKENTDQKNFQSQTKVEDGSIKVETIYTDSDFVVGTTNPMAKIDISTKEKIGQGFSDKDGNFKINIPRQTENTSINILATWNENKVEKKANAKALVVAREKSLDKDLLLSEENEKNKKDPQDVNMKKNQNLGDLENLQILVNAGKNLNPQDASRENFAKIKALVATGEYLLVKTDKNPEEINKISNDLLETINFFRKPYMNGVSKNEFKGYAPMTRAQAAAVFALLSNKTMPSGDYSDFKDVSQEMWYADAVAYVEKNGIMAGYKDSTFKPNKKLTRAEFAQIVMNFKKLNQISDKTFSDVKEDHWAYNAINSVAKWGFMSGRSDKKFAPDQGIKREEVASVINRMEGRRPDRAFIDKFSENPFKDVKKSNWAYYEILEATGK